MKKTLLGVTLVIATFMVIGFWASGGVANSLTPIEELGKALFFDQKLSVRNNQSCASCHAPNVGFTGAIPGVNKAGSVYPGSIKTMFGNRKPPTAAYGGESPVLYYDEDEEVWVGGMFWDGRATGWVLGDPLAEQALGPFLNPVEQALPDEAAVVDRVCRSKYSELFKAVWGPDACTDVYEAYEKIGRSIAAYERSAEVNPFNSRFDAYLAGEAELTAQEAWGLELFEDKGMCAECHISDGDRPLFTDFTYDNLGVPRNPQNPFYSTAGMDWVDNGLGAFLQAAGYADVVYEPELGKQKVPTLRNVDKRPGRGFAKAYGHNGYFKSLKGIVHFYNTRDVKPPCPDPFTTEAQALALGCWPEPEVGDNVNVDELGALGLTEAEEDAIVAFMATLSDGYVPKKK